MTSSVMPAPSPARTGVWIGIAAISMAFAAFTSALLVRQGAAPDWRHFDLPRILYANTFVLLLSSGTIAIAARRLTAAWELAADRPPGAVVGAGAGVAWLVVTLLLGLLFVAGQLFAWRSLASSPRRMRFTFSGVSWRSAISCSGSRQSRPDRGSGRWPP